MNCRSAESLFSAFLDDELNQAERRKFESHLLGCRRCSQSLRELKGAMALVLDASVATSAETSPHFEDDLMDRIRSGEAMRPTVIEWLHGLLTPQALRPIFVVGASACAVVVAAFIIPGSPLSVSKGSTPSQVAASGPATPGAVAPAADRVAAPSTESVPSIPANPTLAAASTRPTHETGRAAASQPSAGGNGIVEIADRVVPSAHAGLDSTLPNPDSQFTDEYVTDRFFLQRGQTNSDPQQPSLVPVTDKTANGVYIEF
ncbi:MAG TPA: zf-HC2 domain-containing protein [Candidatus Eisenbacteria bacterium]|nr:zf-HC2 domain-containing protein [Candidatus Eisenbacteria bacterium]